MPAKRKDEGLLNEGIRAREVMLVKPNGDREVMRTKDAIELAYDENLDLVLVAPNAKPPVAKSSASIAALSAASSAAFSALTSA